MVRDGGEDEQTSMHQSRMSTVSYLKNAGPKSRLHGQSKLAARHPCRIVLGTAQAASLVSYLRHLAPVNLARGQSPIGSRPGPGPGPDYVVCPSTAKQQGARTIRLVRFEATPLPQYRWC